MGNQEESQAYRRLYDNTADVNILLAYRGLVGGEDGKDRGRRPDYVEVINRSAIVLTCAIWEAYCEDLCEEALEKVIEIVGDEHARLPKELRQHVGKKIFDETDSKHVEKIWRLAGGDWKKVLRENLKGFKGENIEKFHWPKWEGVEGLFNKVLGLPKLTENWAWERSNFETTRKRLNHFVELRGDIAHRGKASRKIKLKDVNDFLNLILRIADKMEETVAEHLEACRSA